MGHRDWNRHENWIKRSGQARLVYVKGLKHNIPTTWRWAGRDPYQGQSLWACRLPSKPLHVQWHCWPQLLLYIQEGGGLLHGVKLHFTSGHWHQLWTSFCTYTNTTGQYVVTTNYFKICQVKVHVNPNERPERSPLFYDCLFCNHSLHTSM